MGEPTQPDATSAAARSAAEPLRILYVEDDAEAGGALVDLAGRSGDAIIWESRGEAGLRRAATGDFDVVILDRMMPDLDGLSVLMRLREAGVETPVLMLSALGRAENRVEGLEAGADDYMAKPYEPSELLARVRALHRRSTNRTPGSSEHPRSSSHTERSAAVLPSEAGRTSPTPGSMTGPASSAPVVVRAAAS